MAYNAGDVEAKLTLDRSDFITGLRQARAEAEKFERTYTAKLKVDDAGASRAVTALQRQLVAITAKTWSPKIRLDDTGVLPRITNIRRRLNDLARTYTAKVRIDLDAAGVTQLQKALSAIQNKTIKIDIDINEAYSELMRLNATLNAVTRDRTINIKADADVGSAVTKLTLMDMLVDKLDGRNININANGNGLIDLNKQLGDSSNAANMAEQGMSRYGQRLLLMGSAITVAVGPALGVLTGLLLSVPGVAALAGAGLGAVALGMDGIKAAAKTIEPEFNKMKAAISSTFEQGLIPVFKQLTSLFPILTTGLQSVATGLVGWAQAFTNVVTSAEGMKQIETILANVRIVLDGLQPSVTAMTQAFLTLAEVGTANMGVMVDAINNFTEGFNRMIESAAATGRLSAMFQELGHVTDAVLQAFLLLIDDGIQYLIETGPGLTEFIKQISGLFHDLQPALSAVSNLFFAVLNPAIEALRPLVQAIAPALLEMVNALSPAFAETLKGIGPEMAELGKAIAELLPPLTTLIKEILPLAGPILKDFIDSITLVAQGIKLLIDPFAAFFDEMNALFTGDPLEPSTTAWNAQFGRFSNTVREALGLSKLYTDDGMTKIDESIAAGLEAQNQTLQQGLEPSKSIWQQYWEDLTSELTTVETTLDNFWAGLGESALGAITSLEQTLDQFWAELPYNAGYAIGAFADHFMEGFQQILDWVTSDFWPNFLKGFSDAGSWFATVIPAMMEDLKTNIIQGFVDAGNWVTENFWPNFIQGFVDAGTWFAEVVPAIIEDLKTNIVQGFVDAATWVTEDFWPNFLQGFEDAGTWLADVGKWIVEGLIGGLNEFWTEIDDWVLTKVDEFIQGFKDALGIASPSTIFMDIGRNIIEGLLLGIQEAWAVLVEFFTVMWTTLVEIATTAFNLIITPLMEGLTLLQETWNLVWQAISDFFALTWQIIYETWMLFWTPISEGFALGLLFIQETWNIVWQAISDFFIMIWTLIYETWMMIWTPLYEGIITGLTFIQELWNTVWGAISLAFQTAWLAIQTIFTTAWNFLYNAISTGLQNIQNIWNNAWQAVYNYVMNIWNNIYNFVSNLINNVKNAIQQGMNFIQNLWNMTWNTILQFVVQVWNNIYNAVSNAIQLVRDVINNAINTIKQAWETGWNTIRTTFENVVQGIVQIATDVANTIIEIFNSVVEAINAVIAAVNAAGAAAAGALGMEAGGVIPKMEMGGTVTHKQMLESGGSIGHAIPRLARGDSKVGGGFTANKPQAVVGEGNTAHPEFVIPTDPTYRKRALMLFGALGANLGVNMGTAEMMASGGVLGGDVTSNNTIDKLIKGMSPEQLAVVSDIVKYLQGGIDDLIPVLQKGGDGFTWLSKLLGDKVGPVLDWINEKLKTVTTPTAPTVPTQPTTPTTPTTPQPIPSTGEDISRFAYDALKLMYGGNINEWFKKDAGTGILRDNGGLLPRGLSMVQNNTGSSEKMAVFNDDQWSALQSAVDQSINSGGNSGGGISKEDLEEVMMKLTSRMGPTIGTLSPQLPKDANLKDVVDEIMHYLRHSENTLYK